MSMKIFTPKMDVALMVHPCETENLINVPVDYIAVEVEQHLILEQARDTLNTQMGKMWKRLAHDPHISTQATYMCLDAVGPKRSFQETIIEKDEVLVDGFNKNRKRSKLVEGKHDNEFTMVEANDQPC